MTYDDKELEQIMRDGLNARADETADRIEGRLGAVTPTRESRSSRRGRWLAVAAAAVVAAGVPVAWQALKDDGSTGQVATAPGGIPDGWRAESYGGVQVYVPPAWIEGYGPMPAPDGTTDAYWCMDGAQGAYVGRPVFGSDVCEGFDPDNTAGEPVADSVWFGAPVPEGTVQLGGDYTRVTRVLAGVTVTVETDDPALSEQVLSTAAAVDVDANGCRTHIDGPPSAGNVAGEAPVPFAVCLYDVAADLSTTLVWSGSTSAAAGADYVQTVHDARATGGDVAACKRAPEGQWVALGVASPPSQPGGPGVRWDVVDFACGKVLSVTGDAPLTRGEVEAWASKGTRAYIVGPISGDWSGLFRGMLG